MYDNHFDPCADDSDAARAEPWPPLRDIEPAGPAASPGENERPRLRACANCGVPDSTRNPLRVVPNPLSAQFADEPNVDKCSRCCALVLTHRLRAAQRAQEGQAGGS